MGCEASRCNKTSMLRRLARATWLHKEPYFMQNENEIAAIL